MAGSTTVVSQLLLGLRHAPLSRRASVADNVALTWQQLFQLFVSNMQTYAPATALLVHQYVQGFFHASRHVENGWVPLKGGLEELEKGQGAANYVQTMNEDH